MSSVNVLGIVGSPRQGGNTDLLVDEVLRGAADGGAQVEKVTLDKLEIAPCRACNACLRTGECVQRDDMLALMESMARSQVWVLGTPVYWWGPTAQFKLFVDRWYGARRSISFAGRRAILVIPLGDTNTRTARHLEGMMQDAMAYLNMEHLTTILAPGADERGIARQRPRVVEAAYNAGREAAEKAT
jgi:multimeric flavodoxin WrbA